MILLDSIFNDMEIMTGENYFSIKRLIIRGSSQETSLKQFIPSMNRGEPRNTPINCLVSGALVAESRNTVPHR